MLRRLIYKNTSQHRSSHHMQRLREVARCLASLADLKLPRLVSDLGSMVQLAAPQQKPQGRQQGGKPGGSRTEAAAGRQTHRLPARESCAFIMGQLVIGQCTGQASMIGLR